MYDENCENKFRTQSRDLKGTPTLFLRGLYLVVEDLVKRTNVHNSLGKSPVTTYLI